MRPYGVPRDPELNCPDVATIHQYGLKSRAGRLPGKSGKARSGQKPKKKQNSRRRWKRAARREGKREATET